MNRTWRLLQIQIINFFPVNEMRESKNKKNMAVIVGIGVVMAVLFLCIYNILIAQTLAQVGEEELIPAYMMAVSSFAILFLTLLRSNGLLFGCKDIDMLSSLPVKTSEIISSKFLLLYLLNFLLGFVFMVSGGTVWIMKVKTDIPCFIFYFISVFFVPLIPMCIASFIGILIVLISSRFKNRNIISIIFSFAALGLVGYIGISSMQKGKELQNIGAILAEQITGIYPLSRLFLENTEFPIIAGIIVFIVLSLAAFYLFVKIAAAKYSLLNTLASTLSKYTKHRKNMKCQSQFTALYRKEFGRFFSSYMAVLNSGFSVILLCFFSICLLIMPLNQLGGYVGIDNMKGFLSDYAPIAVAAMLCLSCPAAFSISLEGKNIWILQSSPISVRMILNSKLAVNLTLHVFGYLFAVFSVIMRINMNILQLISLLLVPVCYSLFITVFGIFLNKKYSNYEWESEMMIVKQSIPVIVSSIVAMLVIVIPVLLNWLLSFPVIPALWSVAAVLIAVTIIMYQKICISSYI